MPCETCLDISCINPPDVGSYSLQGNIFSNPEYSFLVSCPSGKVCPGGLFPRVVTIPAGTIVILLPDPTTAGGPLPPLRVECCQSALSAAIPLGATFEQIQAIAAALAFQCGLQQAQCNAGAIPDDPNPGGQPPFLYMNSEQRQTVCPAGFTLAQSGSLPPGFFLDGDDFVMEGGMIGDLNSQELADAAAVSLMGTVLTSLVAGTILQCSSGGGGLNMKGIQWNVPFGPVINGAPPGTGTSTPLDNTLAQVCNMPAGFSATPCSVTTVGTLIYTGPSVLCNLHLVISTFFTDPSDPTQFLFIAAVQQDGNYLVNTGVLSGPTAGTDYPFMVNAGVNSTLLFTFAVQATTASTVGPITSTINIILTPAF